MTYFSTRIITDSKVAKSHESIMAKELFTKKQQEHLSERFALLEKDAENKFLQNKEEYKALIEESKTDLQNFYQNRIDRLEKSLSEQRETVRSLKKNYKYEVRYALSCYKLLKEAKLKQIELLGWIADAGAKCDNYVTEQRTKDLEKINKEIKTLGYELEFWKPVFDSLKLLINEQPKVTD